MEHRTIHPLEVFAIDEYMNRASGTIPYSSLTWRRRYNKPGQFEMSIPADVYDTSWRFIFAYARPETGMIQKVEFSDTAQTPDGRDTVTVSGFFMEEMLNWLTFLVEQPEEKTIEIKVPEPRKPGLTKAQIPQNVYWDPETDSYYYQNSEGDLIDRNGEQVDGESSWVHLEVQIQASNRVDETPVAMPSDTYTSNYYWVDADDPNNVHLKNEMTGLTHVYPIEIKDDKGYAYYHSPTQDVDKIYVASSAITKGAQDGYFAAMRDWTASGGVRYETITVKGPWQRTDMMEPVTESDSIEQMLTWIRRFFGTTFVYEEPTIEGVVKTLDPSLQRMGDFAYSVLQEVGASLRVVYNFVGNSTVLQVYRGLDRTQDQGDDTVIVYDPVLPVGYTQLDWVESSGSNYVDTGFTASNLTGYDIDFEMAGFSGNGDNHILSTNGDEFFVLRVKSDNTGFQVRWGTQGLKDMPHSGSLSGRHSVHMERGVYTCDGGDPISFTPESFVRNQPTPIFAFKNKDGRLSGYTRCRLYSLKMRENGVTERDFYPARRDRDGVVGLYDLHGGQFCTPNTGALSAGPESEIPWHEEIVRGNPWAVFSDTWGTIKGYSASRDDSNYRNVCYVLYSYDQPKSFESDGTPHLEEVTEVQDDGTVKVLGWEVPYETKRGYQVARVNDELEADRECYLDLRESGGAPSCDSQWSRDRYAYDEEQPNHGKPTFEPMQELYEQWPDALTAKGVAELQQNYGVVTNLSTGTVVTSGYMVDWDLGDLVDFGVSTVGLLSEARIIAVDEVYDRNGAEINIEVGDELLTETKRMKLN